MCSLDVLGLEDKSADDQQVEYSSLEAQLIRHSCLEKWGLNSMALNVQKLKTEAVPRDEGKTYAKKQLCVKPNTGTSL